MLNKNSNTTAQMKYENKKIILLQKNNKIHGKITHKSTPCKNYFSNSIEIGNKIETKYSKMKEILKKKKKNMNKAKIKKK